jgi:hypothetical protein
MAADFQPGSVRCRKARLFLDSCGFSRVLTRRKKPLESVLMRENQQSQYLSILRLLFLADQHGRLESVLRF